MRAAVPSAFMALSTPAGSRPGGSDEPMPPGESAEAEPAPERETPALNAKQRRRLAALSRIEDLTFALAEVRTSISAHQRRAIRRTTARLAVPNDGPAQAPAAERRALGEESSAVPNDRLPADAFSIDMITDERAREILRKEGIDQLTRAADAVATLTELLSQAQVSALSALRSRQVVWRNGTWVRTTSYRTAHE